MAERDEEQAAFHIDSDASRPVGPGPAATSFDATHLDFGHYAGQSIEELAKTDPDYLRWLERHPSGVRYRAEIHRVLGSVPSSIDWNR